MSYHVRVLYLYLQLMDSGVSRHQYLAVLFHQFSEVGEERMLLAEEIKLVVSLFSYH